jgi:hypothetical protein
MTRAKRQCVVNRMATWKGTFLEQTQHIYRGGMDIFLNCVVFE